MRGYERASGYPRDAGKVEGASVAFTPSPAGMGGPKGETHSCVRNTTSSREKTTAIARPTSRFSRMVATKVTSQMS